MTRGPARLRGRAFADDAGLIDAGFLSAASLRLIAGSQLVQASPPASIIPALPTQPTTVNVTLPTVITQDSATPNVVVASDTILYGEPRGPIFGLWDGPATSFVNNGTLWYDSATWDATVLEIHGTAGQATNNGVMVARSSSPQEEAYAVYLYSRTTPSFETLPAGPFVNNGQIWAISSGGDASAIHSTSGLDVIVNNGMLAAQASTDPAEPYDTWAPRWTGKAFTINLREAWSSVVNSATGTILAEGDRAIGIWMRGGPPGQAPAWAVDNAGLIRAVSTEAGTDSVGIEISDNRGWISRIRNSGTIEADTAILAPSWGWEGFFAVHAYGVEEILNTATGVIRGRIELHNGDDRLTNNGLIVGTIEMGPGNDVVDDSGGGTIDGIVYLGMGDDQFTGGASAERVLGERNNDQLLGGGGDDLLLGGVGDDLVSGGLGNDGLYGEFGNDQLFTADGDTVSGGDGNDRITLGDYRFRNVAGGAGFDTLVLPGGARSLDLGAILATGRLSGIEAIALGGDKALLIHAADVAALTGGGSELIVSATASDVVNLAGSWAEGTTRAIDGQTYRSFTSAAATVLVQQGATVNLGAEPAAGGLDAIANGAAPPVADLSNGVVLDSGYTLILSDYDPAGGVYQPGGVTVRVEAYEIWESVNGAQAIWNDVEINLPPTNITLDNYGTLLATGDWRWSRPVLIYVGTVNNYGTIWADNPRGLAEAVLAGTPQTRVYNYGEIIATAGLGTAIGIESYGTTDHGEPDVVNEGLIHVESEHGYAIGIGDYNIGAIVTNNGTIEVYGGDGSLGVDLGGSPGIFYNNGEVYAAVAPDSPYLAIGHANAGGTVINTGTIAGEIAIYFMFHQFYQIVLDNQGVIDGEIYMATTPAGALVGNGYITNSGSIHGGLTWDPAYLTNDIITNTGTIDGDVWFAGGNDTYVGTGGFAGGIIYGEGGDDTLTGGSDSDWFAGGADADLLTGAAGDDWLAGGEGIDILDGGSGSDRFAFLALTDSSSGALDRILAFQAGVDKIDLLALPGATVSWMQQSDANGVFTLVTVTTFGGDLKFRVDGGLTMDDFLLPYGLIQGGADPETLTGTADGDNMRGEGGADILIALGGADLLDGGAGADRMEGGAGDDTYYVDDAGDVVVDIAGDGNDRLVTGINFVLGADLAVELLEAAGNAPLDLTGNDFAQTIRGNAGNNLIAGMGGIDILRGDAGNDTLFGNDGGDFLVGGSGVDIMVGGTGDDTYYVDDSADAIGEQAGEGYDRIAAIISLALAADADIERLDVENLASTNALDLTGSAIGNVIYGNDGQNILRGEAGNDELRGFGGNDYLVGGAGTDLMVGGLGDDTFYVDDASDAIGEIAGQGNDRIAASASFILSNGADVEILEAVNVAETVAFDLTGSDSANTITGNAGSNILRGEGGNDILSGAGGDDFLVGGVDYDVMNGGTGNDTYYVDNAGDVVNEFAGEGTADRVVVSASFVLSATSDVELLETATRSDTSPFTLTGSSVANAINGNDGMNLIDGKGGSDILTGFGGSDTFRFSTALGAGNVDTIVDFVHGIDKISLVPAIFTGISGPFFLNADAFFTGAAAHDADDRIIYDIATGALYFDADGDGAGAAIHFATVIGNPALSASDFMVF